MKGYICPISEEELNIKCKAFWGTRTEGNEEVWQFLENICSNHEIEDDFIREYLNAAGLTTYKDCINITYDNRGFIYEIPNYCINPPFKYNIQTKITNSKPGRKEIKVKIRKGIEDMQIKIVNYQKISEVKQSIAEKMNFKESEKIRLFFGGKELKNNEEIWSYLIDDDSIIQLMYNGS
jgi:hypothetical protein